MCIFYYVNIHTQNTTDELGLSAKMVYPRFRNCKSTQFHRKKPTVWEKLMLQTAHPNEQHIKTVHTNTTTACFKNLILYLYAKD